MGLDFDKCDAHWSYSGFMRFRRRLAGEIGIDLDKMFGFTQGNAVSWGNVADLIVPLLHHSDCEGELTPEECKTVAPRLKELVSSWENDDYDKIHALTLADGMLYCVEIGEPLQFQ